MNKTLVPVLSTTAADTLFGTPPAALEAGDLAGIKRRTDAALKLSLHDFTRADILAEIDRTMAALEAYPTTPTLPALRLDDVALPVWSEL